MSRLLEPESLRQRFRSACLSVEKWHSASGERSGKDQPEYGAWMDVVAHGILDQTVASLLETRNGLWEEAFDELKGARGLTQTRIANALGISKGAVTYFKQGQQVSFQLEARLRAAFAVINKDVNWPQIRIHALCGLAHEADRIARQVKLHSSLPVPIDCIRWLVVNEVASGYTLAASDQLVQDALLKRVSRMASDLRLRLNEKQIPMVNYEQRDPTPEDVSRIFNDWGAVFLLIEHCLEHVWG